MALLVSTAPTIANDTCREKSTGKEFPATVSLAHNGAHHNLQITGLAVRKKFFLSIYAMAHYMHKPSTGSSDKVFSEILKDGSTKQVTMKFVRDVGAERIQRGLIDGFRVNTTEAEFNQIRPLVQQFARSLHKDAKKDDQFVVRWLPGGTTISLFQGKMVSTIQSAVFARVLWSIWFGEHSVVKRHSLIELVAKAC